MRILIGWENEKMEEYNDVDTCLKEQFGMSDNEINLAYGTSKAGLDEVVSIVNDINSEGNYYKLECVVII